MYTPLAATHPSVPTAQWTKVTTLAPASRRYLCLANEDQTNGWRYEMVDPDGAAPSGATAGRPLQKGTGGGVGGVYEELSGNRSNADAWVYQASGSPLTSLYVQEGQ